MAVNPKQALRDIVDRLTDAAATEMLALVRRLVGPEASAPRVVAGLILTGQRDPARPRREPPILRCGRPIASADELRGDVFSPEESGEEFEATLRRWREEPEPG